MRLFFFQLVLGLGFFYNINLSFSQQSQKEIDSLKIILKTETLDTSKIKIFNKLSSLSIKVGDLKPAFDFATEALTLSERLIKANAGDRLMEKKIIKEMAISNNYIGRIYMHQGNSTEALIYNLKALDLIESINDSTALAPCLNSIGNVYLNQGNYPAALNYFIRSLKLSEIFKNKSAISTNLGNIGLIYQNQGDFPRAFEFYFKALKIDEESKNKNGVGRHYANIGGLYMKQGDNMKALEYNFISLKVFEEIGNKSGISSAIGIIAGCYHNLKDYDKALEYSLRAVKIDEELGNSINLALNLGNLGTVYRSSGNYSKAIETYFAAMKIDEKAGNIVGISRHLGNIGSLYFLSAGYKEAEEFLTKALFLADSMGILELQKFHNEALNLLYDTWVTNPGQLDNKDEFLKLSYIHYKKFISARDSIFNEENTKKSLRSQMQYDYDKKELTAQAEFDKQQALSAAELEKKRILLVKNKQDLVLLEQENELKEMSILQNKAVLKQKEAEAGNQEKAIELLNKDKQLKEVEAKQKEVALQKQRFFTYASSGGGILVLAFLVFAIRGYQQKNKANEVISLQKQLVEKQKHEVEQQKELVEEKQKEILDSITYAKRLQEAILPPIKLVKKYLSESFILYQPKDIVAGDFYWMEVIQFDYLKMNQFENEKKAGEEITGQLILFASADCTGHGVPGAMVSVVCSNALNRAVKEFGITEPGKILDKVRELVIETFEKSESDVKDGMDISLCALKTNTRELNWAGAYNPLWIIRKDALEIEELKADKQPIGKTEQMDAFTTRSIILNSGDSIYIFTDGFADQFGGEKGKKFKSANFKKLLVSIQDESMEKQQEIISVTFENWKGNLEQVDDVCVIGVRI